ncbi:head maturation protease, ClpP-related [Paraburkholderia azotifigens]|uniref:head maturation protease, ClpP-related n=1 Tax=Paraburkholderia azotifigens TaxID=2057004 RepID=UPI00317D7156
MRPNRILQLLNENRQAPRRFSIEANTEGDEATVYLYDVIVSDDYWGGVGAQSFVKQLAEITASTIHLRINSPGGDVFGARAMEAAIRGHSAKVIAHIDGLAASAASFLAMAADEIEISEGGFFMIHKAWTIAMGNADDMRSQADLLDKIDGSLVNTYASRTGQSVDDIAAWMTAETWFNADEAIANGFADRIAQPAEKAQASAWNLSAYSNAPKAKTEPPKQVDPPAEPEPKAEPVIEQHATPDFAAMRRQLDLQQRI